VELYVAGVKHPATLDDVSRSGMFIRMPEPFPTGIGVRIAMAGVDGERLETRGAIVRSVTKTARTGIGVALREPCEPADELFGLGIEHLMRRAVSERMSPALRGEVADIGLPAVLTMLEHERKTCRLVIAGDRTITIDLVEGRIVDAVMAGSSADAWTTMMAALDLREGRFEMLRTEPRSATFGLLPITHLLLEHARVRDESRANDPVASRRVSLHLATQPAALDHSLGAVRALA
jgi:plasmid maintenance system antidote protein VapI